jgi:hypothetical protein
MITQALSFIGVFFLVYIMPVVRWFYVITKRPFPFGVVFLVVLLYPLGGLFYIFVHNRTNVAALRRRKPEISWIYAFLQVFLQGGEMPIDGIADDRRKRKSYSDEENDEYPSAEQYDSRASYSLQNHFIQSEAPQCSGITLIPSHISKPKGSCDIEQMSLKNMVSTESKGNGCCLANKMHN